MKPLFKHDCPKCIHLGSTDDHDLYFCQQGTPENGRPTVIARWGSGGPDYFSGMEAAKHFVEHQPSAPLAIAYQLAKTQKLIS